MCCISLHCIITHYDRAFFSHNNLTLCLACNSHFLFRWWHFAAAGKHQLISADIFSVIYKYGKISGQLCPAPSEISLFYGGVETQARPESESEARRLILVAESSNFHVLCCNLVSMLVYSKATRLQATVHGILYLVRFVRGCSNSNDVIVYPPPSFGSYDESFY